MLFVASPDYKRFVLMGAAGVAAVAALHRWRGNVLLSIAGGTALYMVLVQAVFV